MRSDTAAPPGSRSTTTGPRVLERLAPTPQQGVFPAPSTPSTEISTPRIEPDARPAPARRRRPGRRPRRARRPTPTCCTGRPGAASATPRATSPPACWRAGRATPSSARLRVQHGTHPDLTWVAPSGAHEMLRRDVDEAVVSAASRTPFEATHRVFVLERADTMNDEAANSLLKTLEEPPPYVVLLLLTDRPTQVLPTISSRCQPVRFDPLPAAALAERLQRSRASIPTTATACARLSLGDGERALTLARGRAARPRRGVRPRAAGRPRPRRARLAAAARPGPRRGRARPRRRSRPRSPRSSRTCPRRSTASARPSSPTARAAPSAAPAPPSSSTRCS